MENSRKSFIISAGIILFILLLTVGSLIFFKMQTGKMTRALGNKGYEEYRNYYVMIVNDSSSELWRAVYEGAREEGLNKSAYVALLGDNLSEEYSREQLMEIAIHSEVDGIIVEADESDRMKELIDAAAAEGIPVVTVLGDNTAGERQSFVGVGNYNLGREYGRQVIRICGRDTKRVLVLMSSSTDGTSQNVLYSGIQETIESEMLEGGRAILDAKNVDNESTFSVEESIRDIFMSKEALPEIIICLDEQSTKCAYQAVVDYYKVGQIDIIGYYNSPETLKAIDRQVIYSTISIDTNQMGRYCVEALNEYNEMGNVSEYFAVDVTVIDQDNVTGFMGGDGENAEEENP